MADSFEIAYLYARICGAFSNMNLGANGVALARSASLSGLWKHYFHEEMPDKPESWILAALERKVIGHSVERFLALAKPFTESDSFINALVAKNEISTIKTMLFRLRNGEPKPQDLSYSTPATEKALSSWPRLQEMFESSPYAWIDENALQDIGATENQLDRQYYQNLWNSTLSLPQRKLGNIAVLVREEVRYQNLIWALRVRRYYGYNRAKTLPLLVTLGEEDTTSLALGTFDLDIDNVASFNDWPMKKLLAGQNSASLDIPLLEIQTQKELFSLVRRSLHLYPFTYTPIYCYFKMLEAEASLVLGMLEGIRLKAPVEERIQHAWALSGDSL